MKLTNLVEAPEFMSCSSFEYPESEFILYNGTPAMLFAVVDEEPKTELYRMVEHQNGDQDYLMLSHCYDPKFYDGKSDTQIAEHIGEVMDQMEGWFISEVIDLESYDD